MALTFASATLVPTTSMAEVRILVQELEKLQEYKPKLEPLEVVEE